MNGLFKKTLIAVLLVLVLSAVCYGAEKKYVLKFNTVAGPQQPEVKAIEVFGETVKTLSSGKITVQVFHSGQLGNQQTQMTGVMRGTIDMTFLDPNTLSQFDKSVGVFGAAYLFRDMDHMYKVMLGPIGSGYFEKTAKDLNVRPLDVWYLGTRQLNLRDRAVMRPEDMKGVKLRMPNSALWIAMGKALGANPTPLGFGEVYMALQTGVVDGQDNPLPTDEAQKFYEVTKYIIMTNHQLGMLWPSINENLWKEMPEQYRTWILKALETARRYENDLVLRGEAELLKKFEKDYGMKIIRPDVNAFRQNARKVYREFENEWGAGMYEKIQAVE